MSEISKLLSCFAYTAFRLETLQGYAVDYESGPLAAFLAGHPRPHEPDDERWARVVASAVGAGKRIQRVHVVIEPPSDYMRFELTWGYDAGVKGGEDIRILPVQIGDWPDDLPERGYDYWMFDSRDVYRMRYDPDGSIADVEPVSDSAEVVQHNVWRDAAMHAALPLASYLRHHPDLALRQAAS